MTKHFGIPAHVIERELLWTRWICYLAVALDLEELDNYRFWVLAQQDPKKFEWSSSDRAGSRDPEYVGQRIMHFAQQRLGAAGVQKGDFWTLARQKGMKPIYQIEKEDGSLMFVDEKGNPTQPPEGFAFVPSRAAKEAHKDKRFFVRES